MRIFINLTRVTTKGRQQIVAWIRLCYNTFQLKVFHEQNSKVVVFYHESDVTIQHSQLWCLKPRQKVLKGCVLTGPGSWREREESERGERSPGHQLSPEWVLKRKVVLAESKNGNNVLLLHLSCGGREGPGSRVNSPSLSKSRIYKLSSRTRRREKQALAQTLGYWFIF